jgi:hypothetical protein
MIKRVIAITALAVTTWAEGVYINTPVSWGTLRSKDVTIQLLSDSAKVGKTLRLKVAKIGVGSKKTVINKKIKVENENSEINISLPSNVVGKEFYKVSIEESGVTLATVVPVSLAPLADKPTAPIEALNEGGKEVTIGDSKIIFGWNSSSLSISGEGSGTVQVMLDPANSKQGFLTFSNRLVEMNFDEKVVSFKYFERKIVKGEIGYAIKEWNGAMSYDKSGTLTATIPWHSLGMKAFSGRILGLGLFSNDLSIPKNGNKYSSSTWGNLILK